MKQIDVLDKGSIELVRWMGDDQAVVAAARVSTGTVGRTADQDAKLIGYLWRNHHTSPFEHVRLTFLVKCPLFVARQWYRHRTASYSSFNEESARYKEFEPEFWLPTMGDLRAQGKANKQAGEGELDRDSADRATRYFRVGYNQAYSAYRALITLGVSREQARAVLPMALYTSFFWTVDLHNLFGFLTLRDDEHAQAEIRAYAAAAKELARPIAPVAFAAWEAGR